MRRKKENYSHFLDEVLTDRENSGLSGPADRRHHRTSPGAVRQRDPGDCAGPRLHGDRRALLLRRGRLDRESAASGEALQRTGHRPRARADQDCVHVGRHRSGGATAKGGHQVQHDAALLSPAGGRAAKRRCNSSHPSSDAFTIGSKRPTSAITPARKIPACNRCARSTPTTKSSVTRPK